MISNWIRKHPNLSDDSVEIKHLTHVDNQAFLKEYIQINKNITMKNFTF